MDQQAGVIVKVSAIPWEPSNLETEGCQASTQKPEAGKSYNQGRFRYWKVSLS